MSLSMLELVALILQLVLFFLARLLDDLSWYDVGVYDEVNVFEGFGVAALVVCVVLQIYRKRNIQGWFKIMFFRSQLKFIIPWSLIITIVILFFNIFGCQMHLPHDE